jgi:very-short-patch-repair endonuclease
LPPTSFFVSSGAGDDGEQSDDDDDEVAAGMSAALTADIESLLDVMRTLLPWPHGQRTLNWHYRSRDERLITFSNAQQSLYDWSLTTFPGALAGDCVTHVAVEQQSTAKAVRASSPDEVARVVELVLEHAKDRPGESLGVIALGSKHADAIREALRLAARTHPELAQIQDESLDEPLFVKNLERVQGDERDAIILTVGYGRGPDGRVQYRFGPINQAHGHRRLNVAITRARQRMTVVSSFSAREMEPDRLRSVGAQMLRDYLLYAESHGTNLGTRARPTIALNPFERDVKEQLEAAGMTLVPQFGASGYRIDFAVMHPDRPAEPLMAIEADGASYHALPTARDRDRLRQEHLERLGWTFHRIWSTDWFRHRERELERVQEAHQAALQSASQINARAAESVVVPTATSVTSAPLQRLARPRIPLRHHIREYSHDELCSLIRWIQSDDLLRTDTELMTAAMTELGFRRRGVHIQRALTAAIAACK